MAHNYFPTIWCANNYDIGKSATEESPLITSVRMPVPEKAKIIPPVPPPAATKTLSVTVSPQAATPSRSQAVKNTSSPPYPNELSPSSVGYISGASQLC